MPDLSEQFKMINRPKPVVLIILDGFGVAPPSRGNAVFLAKTPNFNKYIKTYPTMTLQAAGEAVGLPWGEMGNSEVGHLNLGAGKIVYQDLPRINKAISEGTFFTNPTFEKVQKYINKNNSNLHLIGLVSSGGVHASNEHLYALLEFCQNKKLKKVFIHAILDGRDTPYNSGLNFVKELEEKIKILKTGKIATIIGRFYAMDRDNRWDRIEKAYLAITGGKADFYSSCPIEAIKKSYKNKIFDEEFVPIVITESKGQKNKHLESQALNQKPLATIQDKDAVIFFNFRADRARQLTRAFVLPDFNKFSRAKHLDLLFVTMTQYDPLFKKVEVAFPPEKIKIPLARVISEAGLNQLHMAETEKYAHVTYFFNGGREKPYEKEDQILIPSPSVASYDQKPYMSAREIRERVIKEISQNKYDFIIVNFANPDMVSHTGNLKASIEALETVDECVGQIVEVVLSIGGVVVITADHGNAEEVLKPQTGEIDKEHSSAPVPFVLIGSDFEEREKTKDEEKVDLSLLTPSGVLADVAPTILKIMGLEKPTEMTGRSLI